MSNDRGDPTTPELQRIGSPAKDAVSNAGTPVAGSPTHLQVVRLGEDRGESLGIFAG